MKKSLVALVSWMTLLASAVVVFAQAPPAGEQQPAPATTAPAQTPPAGEQQPAPAAAAPAQPKKIIQNPDEYNAYVAAINTADATKKAQMMESFLQTYPNTVMKEEALEVLLKSYQQLNNTAQIKTTAQRLLDMSPNNLTALALLSYLARAQAQAGGADAAASLQEAGQLGTRGLQALDHATKPEGYSDEQWNTMKSSFRMIFLGSVGHAALQTKDYATAQQSLKEVVALQPTDVNSIYLLARAYLEPKPPAVEGLFWIAKAAGSAPQLLPYAKNQYARYHGSEEGFEELMTLAKSSPGIPEGFTVKPAPSPAEQAAAMLGKSTPEKLSFAEWQFILTNGSKESSDQVWNAIKGKQVQLIAVVIDAGASSLKLAGSVDDIEAKKSDLTLLLREPLAPARIPRVGTELTIQGAPSEFSATPESFNMVFTEGEVLKGLAEATPTPAKKPSAGGVRRKTTP